MKMSRSWCRKHKRTGRASGGPVSKDSGPLSGKEFLMSQHERDALVLSLLAYVSPLLRMYASKYRKLLNYDDLYQDAAVHIMRLIDAGTPIHKLQGYAWNRVQSRMIDRIK